MQVIIQQSAEHVQLKKLRSIDIVFVGFFFSLPLGAYSGQSEMKNVWTARLILLLMDVCVCMGSRRRV